LARRPIHDGLGTLLDALGGEKNGNGVLCPAPGHSPHDRGMRVWPDRTDPLGFKVHLFNGGDWKSAKDYVARALGIQEHWARVFGGNLRFLSNCPNCPSVSAFLSPRDIWDSGTSATGGTSGTAGTVGTVGTAGPVIAARTDRAVKHHPPPKRVRTQLRMHIMDQLTSQRPTQHLWLISGAAASLRKLVSDLLPSRTPVRRAWRCWDGSLDSGSLLMATCLR
jgi:hypothetical protein